MFTELNPPQSEILKPSEYLLNENNVKIEPFYIQGFS